MTTAFNFARVDTSVPSLPQPSVADNRVLLSSCAASAPLDLATDGTTSLKQLEQTVVAPYPVTVNSHAPAQEPGNAPSPSGPVKTSPYRNTSGGKHKPSPKTSRQDAGQSAAAARRLRAARRDR
jgi:hypothetical protein